MTGRRWTRGLWPFACLALALVSTVLIWGFVERSRWVREMNAQCNAARPLVSRQATKDEVLRELGQTVERTKSELPALERVFAGTPPKLASIRQGLQGSGTVLIYSRSSSIMLVFLDPSARAVKAECFLQ